MAAQHESVKRARELDEEADAAKKEEKKYILTSGRKFEIIRNNILTRSFSQI